MVPYAARATPSAGQLNRLNRAVAWEREIARPWGQIAAASVAATLPLALLTFLFQTRIVAGLTAGAVKE